MTCLYSNPLNRRLLKAKYRHQMSKMLPSGHISKCVPIDYWTDSFKCCTLLKPFPSKNCSPSWNTEMKRCPAQRTPRWRGCWPDFALSNGGNGVSGHPAGTQPPSTVWLCICTISFRQNVIVFETNSTKGSAAGNTRSLPPVTQRGLPSPVHPTSSSQHHVPPAQVEYRGSLTSKLPWAKQQLNHF